MKWLLVCRVMWIAAVPAVVAAQEVGLPLVRNYRAAQYKGHEQNWAIVQDRRGLMYFGNTTGIMEYDGVSWRHIAVTNRTAVKSLAVDTSGTIYVGAKGDFGFLKPDSVGEMRFVSLLSKVDSTYRNFSDVWRIHVLADGVYFQATRYLFRWAEDTMTYWTSGTGFHTSFSVNGRLYVRQNQRGLMRMEGDSLRMAPGGELFRDERIYVMLPYDDRRLLIGCRSSGLYLYDGLAAVPFHSSNDSLLLRSQVYDGVVTSDTLYAFATLHGGVLIIDKQARVVANFNKHTGLQDETVYQVFRDRDNVLWMALNQGISRLEWPSPIAILDERHELPKIINDIARYQDQLYVGTFNGLYAWKTGKFRPIEPLNELCLDLLATEGSLILGTSEGAYEVRKDKVRTLVNENVLSVSASTFDKGRIYVGLKNGCGVLENEGQEWIWAGRVPGISEEIRSIADDGRHVWFVSIFQGAVRVPASLDSLRLGAGVERYGLADGLPDLKDLEVVVADHRVRFLTRKGVFLFDESERRFKPDSNYGRLYDYKPYRVFKMTEIGGLVCLFADEKIGLAIRDASGNLAWKIPPFDYLASMDQVNCIFAESSGVFWLGTMNGIIRFDGSTIFPSERVSAAAMIRQVTLGRDSVIFGGASAQMLSIGYSSRELRFEFAAPLFDMEQGASYQCFLEEFDDSWSAWSRETFRVYTNVPEGRYLFRVRARDSYGRMTPEGVLEIEIQPPWYRTWWAFWLYAGMAFLLVHQVYKWRVRVLTRRTQELEVKVADRTRELLEKTQLLDHQNTQLVAKNRQIEVQQEEIIQSRKMSALGQMVAGLLHEISNPLSFVHGNLEFIGQEIRRIAEEFQRQPEIALHVGVDNAAKWADELDKFLRGGESGTERIKLILQHLREFSALDVSVRNEIDLPRQLDLVWDLFTGSDTELTVVKTYRSTRRIEGHPTEINQCLANLITNAVQAVKDKARLGAANQGVGRIELRTEDRIVDGKAIVRLIIQDSGIGISESDLPKVFDPFFTTRDVGKGKGLGLSDVYGIVKKHQARIDVQSRLGEGTAIVIDFPAIQD